jgi:hypothetical protein
MTARSFVSSVSIRLVNDTTSLSVNIASRFNGSNNEQIAAILSDYTLIQRISGLSPIVSSHRGRSITFRRQKPEKIKTLSASFRQRRSASITPETPVSTLMSIEKRNYLTIEQLKDFLQNEQHMLALSIEDCARLIARFEPSIEGRHCEQMGVDGFRLLLLHDEFCLINADKLSRVYHDMTRPLTDYFIATTHNTYVQRCRTGTFIGNNDHCCLHCSRYIQGNQVFGSCTPETYIHALRMGCRAVESNR